MRTPIFASSYLVVGLEKGGGNAAKNSPSLEAAALRYEKRLLISKQTR